MRPVYMYIYREAKDLHAGREGGEAAREAERLETGGGG
jgi:hypothetical protein